MSQTHWWEITDDSGRSAPPVARSDMQDEREVITREVNFEVEAEGDGRTLITRIVPYNEPVEVADPPFYEKYVERWKPGVFDKQLRAANRVDVLLNFEHEKGLGGVVGRGTALRSQPDGLHGVFRLLGNQVGEAARELVRERVLTGMSLEAIVLKSRREADGSMSRLEARLKNVALCRTPAFPGAEVLAVRTEGEGEPAPGEPDPDEPGDPEPSEPESQIVVPELRVDDDKISAVLERVGVELLVKRATTTQAWDGSPSRFSDEEYQRSALICRAGDEPPKTRCSLPVLEPNGDLNINAMHAAAARINQLTGIGGAERATAARRLIRLYRSVNEEPPGNLVTIASR